MTPSPAAVKISLPPPATAAPVTEVKCPPTGVRSLPVGTSHITAADPARFTRVIEGTAEEVTEADGRLLAQSILEHGADEAHDDSHEPPPEEGGTETVQ